MKTALPWHYETGPRTKFLTVSLRELYGLDVSPDLVSAVTDAVLEEVAEWRVRPDRTRSVRKPAEPLWRPFIR